MVKLQDARYAYSSEINRNGHFSKVRKENFDFLVEQAEKLEKLHFDLLQHKKIGGQEVISIDYLLQQIEETKGEL